MVAIRTKPTHSTPRPKTRASLRLILGGAKPPVLKDERLSAVEVSRKLVEDFTMLAYEFYWLDQAEEAHLIGILPERRKRPERITQESILNWGKMVIGDNSEVKELYYVTVEI